jgi:acyl-CoA thioester hydrolase
MSDLRSSRVPTRGDFRYWSVIPTRWADNDHYGHINNAVYYAFFDTAISGLLMGAVGSDVRKLEAIGLVAETGCRYLKELSYPDLLNVGVLVEKLGRSSVIYRLGIFRDGDEVPAAIGRFVHVYVDRETHRVAQVPELIRAALSRLQPAQAT